MWFVFVRPSPDANNFVNAGVPDELPIRWDIFHKAVGLDVPNMAKLGLGNIERGKALNCTS